VIRLIRVQEIKDPDSRAQWLGWANAIRAHYPFSNCTYDDGNSKNLWLVRWHIEAVGFLVAEIQNTDLILDRRMHIFVHDLHLDPKRQRGGIGARVLNHLLNKGVDLEFVIARANEKVWGLVRKFSHIERFATENTVTICIPSRQGEQTT